MVVKLLTKPRVRIVVLHFPLLEEVEVDIRRGIVLKFRVGGDIDHFLPIKARSET